MPIHIFIYFRRVFPAYFFLAAAAIFTLFTPSAHADPHAVFYTDRAQEQLFFNVLAALNQADYVEPVTGQFSRDLLVDARATADPDDAPVSALYPANTSAFIPEQNPIINATNTNLPAALTRSITLEGNDLWTAYLVYQLALETDVRRTSSELLRKLCTAGLGIVGCDTKSGPANRTSTAFPTNINQYAGQENHTIAGGLSSGTQEEEEYVNLLTGTKKASTDDDGIADALHPENVEPTVPEYLKFPRAFSPELAELRQNIEENPGALNIVNQTTANVLASRYNTLIDPTAFNGIKVSADQKTIEVAKDMTFEQQLAAIRGLGSIIPGSIAIAEQSREQGAAFQAYRERTPSLAKYTLTKNEGGGAIGTLTIPSAAIEAQINEGVALVANQTVNQKFAASTEITTPGIIPALSRGQVEGISTETILGDSNKPGEVAGITATNFAQKIYALYDRYYKEKSPATSAPSTGLIGPPDETGNAEFLQAIGGTNPNTDATTKDCGFCTSLNSILTEGASSLYTDLYCFFYPRTEYCTKLKL